MNRHRPIPALLACLMVAACGAAVAPAALVQLEAEWGAVDAERLAAEAPEASREAADWLARAREALSAGEVEAAERFAGLGSIALRTAALHLRRLELGERARSAEEALAGLQRERERLDDALELARREEERKRLRVHLETVVDAERRRAAADEELRDAALPPKERKALDGARLAIAAELEARARVALAALLGLAEAGVLIPEQAIPLVGDIDLAVAAVASGDLAGAQEHCENAGVHARGMIDDAFDAGGEGYDSRVAALGAQVRGATGLADRARDEELGVGLSLAVRFTGKGILDRGSAVLVEETAAALGGLPGLAAVLVVARAGREAAAVAEALRPRLGERRPAVTVLPSAGVGSAAPLVALRTQRNRVGLLLIPLPAEAGVAP